MRHPVRLPGVRLPSEVKLALVVIAAIVLYALYKVGGPALALASNAVAAIAGWMGRGLTDRLTGAPEPAHGARPPATAPPGPSPAAAEPSEGA